MSARLIMVRRASSSFMTMTVSPYFLDSLFLYLVKLISTEKSKKEKLKFIDMYLKYIIFAFAFMQVVFSDAQIYVSTKGKDYNTGSKDYPLATLTAARDAVRKLHKEKGPDIPVTVFVEDGYYEMLEPLVLKPEDSGTKENPVVYRAAKGASPVFSGGRRIHGFEENGSGIWEIKIPECADGKFRFDQLYVNGKRVTLAKIPNKGYWYIKDIREDILIKGNGRSPERSTLAITLEPEDFKVLANMSKNDLDLVRFRAFHKWDFTLRYIDSIDIKNNIVFTTGQGMKPWNSLRKGGRVVFENFMTALDEPGEWFLSNDGTLFYYPREGEDIKTAEVVIPVLDKLISVEGNASEEENVKNINFEGLTFVHCNYQMPRSGFEPNQAAASIDAAIHLTGAVNVNFTDCSIEKTGQHALWLGKGCNHCKVSHCYINDVGGGGIYLGETKALEGLEHTSNITIENSIIHSGGREFPPAVGIWVGHSSDNIITHNDIGDFYYTGISVGWVWGYAPSLAKRNIITYNNIHHIGWALLSDMAAVYTLGKSEGTKINNNVIHHVHAYSYGGWGLYPDEGTSDIEMKNNLVYSTKTGGFHQHYGANNMISNNIFAFAKLYQLQCTRVEDHLSFTLENNIVVFDEGVVLKGAWDKIRIKMDHNLYWNYKGDDYDFNGKSFKKWQKTGHDTHSIIADPGFKDVENFDFRLHKTKVVKRIGFVPFDYSTAGVYGNKEWMKKARLSDEISKEFDKVVEDNLKKRTGRD